MFNKKNNDDNKEKEKGIVITSKDGKTREEKHQLKVSSSRDDFSTKPAPLKMDQETIDFEIQPCDWDLPIKPDLDQNILQNSFPKNNLICSKALQAI